MFAVVTTLAFSLVDSDLDSFFMNPIARVYKIMGGGESVQWGGDLPLGPIGAVQDISISSDGSRVALSTTLDSRGVPLSNNLLEFVNGSSPFVGNVRVFEVNDTGGSPEWFQLGNEFNGTALGEEVGFAIDLNGANSDRLAWSQPERGLEVGDSTIKTYEFNTSSQLWDSVIPPITANNIFLPHASLGVDLQLSSDGDRLAVASFVNLTTGINSTAVTIVQVFDRNLTSLTWGQVGGDIVLPGVGGAMASVSISGDGRLVAVGTPFLGEGVQFEAVTLQSGNIKIYSFENGDWNLYGNTLYGEYFDVNHGWSVNLDMDGSHLVGGAPGIRCGLAIDTDDCDGLIDFFTGVSVYYNSPSPRCGDCIDDYIVLDPQSYVCVLNTL